MERSTRIEHGPREKLAASGAESLSDGELLAILLGTGTQHEPVPALAEKLLAHAGGLRGLSRAGTPELSGVSGIGLSKAARISAALELGRRVSSLPLKRGERLQSSQDVYRIFGPLLNQLCYEELWAIALDARQRVLSKLLLARGGLSGCALQPADVFRPLVREAASAVILVHNHPSGSSSPSTEDLGFTERLAQVGDLLGISVLDHVIVGSEGYYSCLDAGLWRKR